MSENEEVETVEAPALVVPPTRHEQAKAAHGAKVWTWIARITGLALLAAVLGFGFYLAAANAGARTDRADLIAQLDEAQERLDEERAKVDALIEQVQAAGEEPVVDATDARPGEPGSPGERGPAGEPGRAPTSEEVLVAVNAYCASIGGCRGADGTNGQPGTPGAPGETIVGPQGPAGPAGPQGEQGIPGMNGISVTGVSCVLRDDLSTAFRFTFSDVSFVDVPGACLP